MRDLVVVLPGITGSVLQKDGRDLWAISGQAIWRALTSLGRSLDDLRLADPEGDDGVRATGLIEDAHLVPGLIKVDGYTRMAGLVRDHFEVVEGALDDPRPANFFAFPYDWRRDNRTTAAALQNLIEDRLRRWRDHSGASDARVILMAHSMGGLVCRYYLEVLEGWQTCRALVTFGTPHRGSVNAVDFLANGFKKRFPDLTEVMRSFPSSYQLLPIYPAVQADGEYHRVAELDGLPGVDAARAADGLRFHREIEESVNRHRDDAAYLRRGYAQIPIVGTAQRTLQSARLTDGALSVSADLPAGIDPRLGDGDGTVPRLSAIPLELSDAFPDTLVGERHSSLQNNAAVLDDLRERLRQTQIRGLGQVRRSRSHGRRIGPGEPAIALDVEDVYVGDEPVALGARLIDTFAGAEVAATVEPVNADGPSLAVAFRDTGDGDWVAVVDGLFPGLYRVAVTASTRFGANPGPVHDLFEVVP